MSGVRIKAKIVSPACNPEKDLEQTAHSAHPTSCSPYLKCLPELNSTHPSGVWPSRIQSEDGALHNTGNRRSCRTTQEIESKQFFKQVNWTYRSPLRQTTNLSCQFNSSFNLAAQPRIEANSTPRSKGRDGQKWEKIINKLDEVDTIESKFMMSRTPRQLIEQSEIVLKGSRDIGKIIPIKLIYEDREMMQPETQLSQHHTENPLPEVMLIKNKNDLVSLVLFPESKVACSVIKLESAYSLEHYVDEGITQPYFKRKQGHTTYLFCEPYEYTLDELIKEGKINSSNMKIVCKHLESALRALCSLKCSFFEIEGIEKAIFYTHGKFKLIPIFKKGRVQTCRSPQQLQEAVQLYLAQLL